MKILIITENEDVYLITKEIVSEQLSGTVILCSFNEISEIMWSAVDAIIIDFDGKMVEHGNFSPIIEIKCKAIHDTPILAILEKSSIQNIFTVLKMGVWDYMEKEKLETEYERKIRSLMLCKWYLGLGISVN